MNKIINNHLKPKMKKIVIKQGEDYCSKGHACHTNATCLNLNTKYSCICDPGFQGDGFDCLGKSLFIIFIDN